jgi:hypothetical protein
VDWRAAAHAAAGGDRHPARQRLSWLLPLGRAGAALACGQLWWLALLGGRIG